MSGFRGRPKGKGRADLQPLDSSPSTRPRRVAVDLYSGTGGATAAFRGSPEWSVVCLDISAEMRPDVVADIRQLPIRRADFLWASPPCQEFSQANPGRPAAPSLEHFQAVFEAVRLLRPRFWVLENVRGAIPFLGIPVQKIGPWCLWGYFPPVKVTTALHSHRKSRFRTSRERAAIPAALSLAVRRSVERFWDLPRLLDMRELRPYRNVRRRNQWGLTYGLPWD